MTRSHLSTRARLFAVPVLATVVAAAVGCAPDSSGTAGSGSAGGSKTLTWTTGTALGTLDVIKDQVNGTTRRLLLGSVAEALTKVNDVDGTLSWTPMLATKWERVDATHWQFTLRDGVKFSDGSTLDATDVAYSINKLAGPDSDKDSTLANIKGASVVDSSTVSMETNAPDFFAYRSAAEIPIEPDGWGSDAATAQNTLIGTGPYKIASVSTAHDDAVLETWDGYWGTTKPYYDKIEMKVVADPGARLAGISAGEADVSFDLPPDLLQSAPATLSTGETEVDILRINALKPPLDDQRVRQALNYAVDRSVLIDNVRLGFATAPNGQGITSQVHGYDDALTDYPFDLAKAKQLITDAGATGSTLTMMCPSDYYGSVGTDTCQSLASMYEAAGVHIKLQLLPREQWVDQGLLAPQNHVPPPDLFYVQAGSETLDATTYIQNYLTCGTVRATFCDQGLKAEAEAALQLTDEDAQATAFAKVMGDAHDLAPMVWLTSPKNAVAAQKGISGTLYSDASTIYWSEWKG